MKSMIFIVLGLCYSPLISQEISTFQYFDNQNEPYKQVVKKKYKDSVLIYTMIPKHGTIHKISLHYDSICKDTTTLTLRYQRPIDSMVNEFDLSFYGFVQNNNIKNILFKTYEGVLLKIKNDTLVEYDFFVGKNEKFSQRHYYSREDIYKINGEHFFMKDSLEKYASSSFHFFHRDSIKRITYRWEKQYALTRVRKENILLSYNTNNELFDSTIYYYNNRPNHLVMYMMDCGEESYVTYFLDRFVIFDELVKLRKTKKGDVYENKVLWDSNNRLAEIRKYKNTELRTIVKIKYP